VIGKILLIYFSSTTLLFLCLAYAFSKIWNYNMLLKTTRISVYSITPICF